MSIVSRISTYSVFSNTLRDVNGTQAGLFDLQKQISSGFKTDNFQGLNGQVEQFTFLEAKIKKAQSYEDNNAVGVSRLQTANVALDQIIQIAGDMQNLITLRRDGALKDNIQFEQQMKGKIEALASELNTSFEGKFLFGGTRSNVPPIKTDPSIPTPITYGTLDAGYYQGSQENTTLRADDNVEITNSIRADNTGFQKLFHAAAWSIDGHVKDDDSIVSDSLDLLQSGIQDVIATQASNNVNITRLNDINDRHDSLRLYWKGVSEAIVKTDLVSASTQVAVDQAVLQATFQSFSVVNKLRLIDFLR